MAIVSAQTISFIYQSGDEQHSALNHVSLDIEKGEFIAIVGHNGSGKSTLAKHINAILIPTEGKMLVKDMDTMDDSLLLEIRKTAGMVFQNPDNQIVATVVEEDVAFAPENMGVSPPEIRERVDKALETVNMSQYKRHAPHLLSGGQKQRIAIAGVLAMLPEVLVLDEPTAMLDPQGREEVIATIRHLNRESGMTVVLITHHMEEAALADRIAVVSDGEIVKLGPPKEIFSDIEGLKAVSLAAPQNVELMYELNKHGAGLSLAALSIEETADEIARWLEGK